MNRRTLIVMTRAPRRGAVKRRLARTIGEDRALVIHRELVEHTLEQVREYAALCASQLDVVVNVEGDVECARRAFGAWPSYRAQPAGDLGDRLADAFGAAFDTGAGSACAIGTDCPRLDAPTIAEAFDRLAASEVVLGPARDGGYYLIGFTGASWPRAREVAFEAIPWSTPRTADVTRSRLASAGLSLSELDVLADVDEAEDLGEWESVRTERSRRS